MARAAQKTRPEAEWAKVRAAYIAGEGSYRDLAKRFGVAVGTLMARAAREKWQAKREQADHRTDEKTIDAVADRRARLAALRWGVGERIANAVQSSLDQVGEFDPEGLAAAARALNTAIPADHVPLDASDGEGVEVAHIIIRRGAAKVVKPGEA